MTYSNFSGTTYLSYISKRENFNDIMGQTAMILLKKMLMKCVKHSKFV